MGIIYGLMFLKISVYRIRLKAWIKILYFTNGLHNSFVDIFSCYHTSPSGILFLNHFFVSLFKKKCRYEIFPDLIMKSTFQALMKHPKSGRSLLLGYDTIAQLHRPHRRTKYFFAFSMSCNNLKLST